MALVQRFLEWGLIECDNGRGLTLKGGGTTDIYLKERDARNHSEATALFAKLYARPLNLLGVDRFVEVPAAVSGIAGALSVVSGIPYLTIREVPKEGRVGNRDIIGNPRWGESIVIVDDVVTDGGSKVIPIQRCGQLGLRTKAIVVVLDRQQGWQQNFARLGITVPVWAGMTLHDMRRCLIQMGAMQRCDPEVEAKNPLIVALDGKSWEEILPIIDVLRTTGCILKVNDLLLNKGIEWLLPNLSVYGRVMADLKAHDIPETVRNICKHLRACPPWAVTVHATGGGEMVKAAVEILEGLPTKILAVTVLTSIKRGTCEEIYTRRPLAQVKVLAEVAWKAGARGFVCSPKEVGVLRKLYPEAEPLFPEFVLRARILMIRRALVLLRT